MKSVAGKTVLVTGAAMGLGKLFATTAVTEGAAHVVLWDINEGALKDTAAELEAAGGTRPPYVVDVSSHAASPRRPKLVRAEVGDVHVLVNNAGIVRGNGYFWENAVRATSSRRWRSTRSRRCTWPASSCPAMIESGEECRVHQHRVVGRAERGAADGRLRGSKWAAVGWSDSVRLELEQAGHDHVRVTTVCPTYINTGMFDGAKGILLTPMLEQDEVVDGSWKAMLKGGPFLIIPWTSRLNKVLSGVLPVRAARRVAEPRRRLQLDGRVHRSRQEVTRSWWGWGTDEAALAGAELHDLEQRVRALLPDHDLTDHVPPDPHALDLRPPRDHGSDDFGSTALGRPGRPGGARAWQGVPGRRPQPVR